MSNLIYLFVGGGALRWIVSKNLHLDGLITAKGENGKTSGYSGGGSGGSILIETVNMTGHGEVNVNGGSGYASYGGGGSGGRIGIHVSFQNNFGGNIYSLFYYFAHTSLRKWVHCLVWRTNSHFNHDDSVYVGPEGEEKKKREEKEVVPGHFLAGHL